MGFLNQNFKKFRIFDIKIEISHEENCDVTIFQISKNLFYLSLKCAKFQQNQRTFFGHEIPKFRLSNRILACLKIVTSQFSKY